MSDKVYTWANQAGFDFFGEDVIGKQASHYFEGEQATYEKVESLFEGDESVVYLESWQRRVDGQKRLLAWWCRVIKDVRGNVTGAISTGRDITERKQAEQNLRESEARFRFLLESAPVAAVIADMEGKINIINSKTEQIFGYSRDELVGQPIGLLMPERYRQGHSEHISKYFSEPKTRMMGNDLEISGLRKDGSEIPLEVRLSFVQSKEGILGMSFISDISERKRANEALKLEKAFSDQVINSIPGIFYVFDETGRFIRWNDNFSKISEYSDDEIAQMHPTQFFRGADQDHIAARIQKVFEEGIADAEAAFTTKSGRGLPHYFTGLRTIIDDKPLLIGTGVDITERKQAEEALQKAVIELERSNVELEQFAYIASHDLQEPLRAVAGMVQLLQQRYQGKLDERADEYIHLTVEAATRMQKLIDDLLAYSRVDRRGSQFVQIEMDKILKSALANLSTTIRESEAVVTHDPLPTLVADPAQLTRVFQNLIGNGIKFRGERPPEVHIGAQELDKAWRFEVRDNGIGIEPQYHERIFLIFQRLHGRSEYPGTGIGLSLCQKIVENHGGRIWIEFEAGQGSRFYFTIPHRR